MQPGTKRRILVLVATPIALYFAWHLGLVDAMSDVSRWRAFVEQHRVLGAVLFVVVHALAAAAGIPSVVFLVPSTLIFPRVEAFVLGMGGAMLGSMLGFELARGGFRSWVEPRVPKRLRRWDDAIAENEYRAVTVIRLTFFLLPPVAWALGLTKVRRLPYFVGTFLGTLPGVLFFTFVGGSFFDWLASQPLWVWVAFGVVVAAYFTYKKLRPNDEDA